MGPARLAASSKSSILNKGQHNQLEIKKRRGGLEQPMGKINSLPLQLIVRRKVNNKCRDMSSRLRGDKTSIRNISSNSLTGLLLRAASPRALRRLALVLAAIACTSLIVCGPRAQVAAHPEIGDGGTIERLAPDTARATLEAELNALLQGQQQGQDQDASRKILSEAIISRLMVGNMSDLGPLNVASGGNSADLDGAQPLAPELSSESTGGGGSGGEDSGSSLADAVRLRKVLSLLQSYQMMQGDGGAVNGGQPFSQYPVLPASQAATIKRASMKMGNYLRAQQQAGQHAGQRQVAGYGRVNSFDFGLGKRPDASVSGNILRFGDSASPGGHMAAVSGASGLGKRPSAHRYDFGLGKRVASPTYPRYDFGLGKRAPSRLRYDFGLGRRR